MKKKVEQWFRDNEISMVSGWMDSNDGEAIVVEGTLGVYDVSDLSSMGLDSIGAIGDKLLLSFRVKSLAEWEGND